VTPALKCGLIILTVSATSLIASVWKIGPCGPGGNVGIVALQIGILGVPIGAFVSITAGIVAIVQRRKNRTLHSS